MPAFALIGLRRLVKIASRLATGLCRGFVVTAFNLASCCLLPTTAFTLNFEHHRGLIETAFNLNSTCRHFQRLIAFTPGLESLLSYSASVPTVKQ